MHKDTLFYDGACPLCRSEMDKLARLSQGRVALVDIHSLASNECEVATEVLLSRLHLKTAEGQWITGLSANVRAWQHTPFRHFWRILEWPLIRPISHHCYELWLRLR